MTREDICTCGQYSQCPTCGKSRADYAELMLEYEALQVENARVQDELQRISVALSSCADNVPDALPWLQEARTLLCRAMYGDTRDLSLYTPNGEEVSE